MGNDGEHSPKNILLFILRYSVCTIAYRSYVWDSDMKNKDRKLPVSSNYMIHCKLVTNVTYQAPVSVRVLLL